jgi:hypothetical protein
MEVTIEGLDELKRRLDTKRFEAASKVAIGLIARDVMAVAKVYPAEGPWCMPSAYPHRWWQRGKGARWRHVDGTFGVGRPSERMQASGWSYRVLDSWTSEVKNAASYAPWVKGIDQAAAHAAHGWKTLEADADALARKGVFVKFYAEEIDKVLGGG